MNFQLYFATFWNSMNDGEFINYDLIVVNHCVEERLSIAVLIFGEKKYNE